MGNQKLSFILCLSAIVLLKINAIRADFSSELRIKNGTDASYSATRHQVSIRNRQLDSVSFGEGHNCGGSLISENVVLTAAHCVLDSRKNDGSFASEEEYIVVMGTLDRLKYSKDTLIYNITKIITWGDYFNETTLANDIALLLLNGKVPAKHPIVRPIILNDIAIESGTICQTTGWGITENNVRAEKLRTIDLPFLDAHDCRESHPIGSKVSEGMICAGKLKDDKSPCTADSGGPLVCKGSLAGVVSWGACFSLPYIPTVYADVAYYKNWLLDEVAFHGGALPKFVSTSSGVTNLSCSLFVISLMLIFHFLHA